MSSCPQCGKTAPRDPADQELVDAIKKYETRNDDGPLSTFQRLMAAPAPVAPAPAPAAPDAPAPQNEK